jgi:hypothetical protein
VQLRPGPLLKAVRYVFLLVSPHFVTLKVHTTGSSSALAGFARSVAAVVMVARYSPLGRSCTGSSTTEMPSALGVTVALTNANFGELSLRRSCAPV